MKDRRLVIDTGPLFLYFAGDKDATSIIDSARRDGTEVITSEVVMAEFYYKTCEKFGRDVSELRSASIRKSGISVNIVDERLTRVASILKCTYKSRVSVVDSYVLALCKIREARLITTDSALKALNLVPATLLKVPDRK